MNIKDLALLHFPPYQFASCRNWSPGHNPRWYPPPPPSLAFYRDLLFAESQLKHEYKHELCRYKLAKT